MKKEYTMSPLLFETPQERFEKYRKSIAIFKEMTIGGRLFCWHNWTYFCPSIRRHLLDWGSLHKCTKCGKSKVFKERVIEPII